MKRKRSPYFDLSTDVGYDITWIRRHATRGNARAAIRALKAAGQTAFSLSTFYAWKRREVKASEHMLCAIAEIMSFTIVAVPSTHCRRQKGDPV